MSCCVLSNLSSSSYFLFLSFLSSFHFPTPLAFPLSSFSLIVHSHRSYTSISPLLSFLGFSHSSFPSALYVPCICFCPCIQLFLPSIALCLSNHPYHLLDFCIFLFRLYAGFYLVYPSKPVTSILSNLILDTIHGDFQLARKNRCLRIRLHNSEITVP